MLSRDASATAVRELQRTIIVPFALEQHNLSSGFLVAVLFTHESEKHGKGAPREVKAIGMEGESGEGNGGGVKGQTNKTARRS